MIYSGSLGISSHRVVYIILREKKRERDEEEEEEKAGVLDLLVRGGNYIHTTSSL